jgi:hypothetical protein
MAAHNESGAVIADIPAGPSAVQAEGAVRIRLCGRCRKPADWDPADPPAGQAAWWLCPPCREALIGGVGRGRQS